VSAWFLLKPRITKTGHCCRNVLRKRKNRSRALLRRLAQVEEEEDERIYHSKGWCRELWIQSLGMDAVLPPPEEKQNVKSAIEAGRAKLKNKVA
jgi:hypothetical protein